MKEELIKLSSIASSFERKGDMRAGKIITDVIKKIANVEDISDDELEYLEYDDELKYDDDQDDDQGYDQDVLSKMIEDIVDVFPKIILNQMEDSAIEELWVTLEKQGCFKELSERRYEKRRDYYGGQAVSGYSDLY